MPLIVTENAVITCIHSGEVTLSAKQHRVTIQGGAVLCDPDLLGAPIQGCKQPASPGTKPCSQVISVLPTSTSKKVSAAGKPVYVATLDGLTDGVPPSKLIVVNPGQTVVQA